jgi:hypothetical protein
MQLHWHEVGIISDGMNWMWSKSGGISDARSFSSVITRDFSKSYGWCRYAKTSDCKCWGNGDARVDWIGIILKVIHYTCFYNGILRTDQK